MIKIGDFARLSQLSVVTLRHYDELGLLKPIAVDSATGYRYYSVSQLPRLNRLLALKDFGFSLEQIDRVLSGDLSLEQLRGMLKIKQAEVEQRLEEDQARLARIEARLRLIENEDTMPDYEVILKTVAPTLVASRTVTIPTNRQVPAFIGPAFDEAYAYLRANGAKDTGPCFAIWHQGAHVLVNEVAETSVPIDRSIEGSDRVKVYELPQAIVASTIHRGDPSGFSGTHKALLRWIEANGYRTTGGYREIYLSLNPKNMADAVTEVQYPIEKG